MHRNPLIRHLSYANVMATIGVFIALGGASYAAVALPANSVGTKALKKSAVAASKIKTNAVSSAKVKDGSLQQGDFARGTLVQGPQGLQGPKGDPGAAGAPGISGYQRIEASGGVLNVGEQGSATASCPGGKKALGGGVSSDAYLGIVESQAVTDTQWRVTARNLGPSASGFSAFAVCANVG